MSTIYQRFGENVKILRKQRGLKQEKLAEMAKNTSFSAKYLNLLARQGKLEAYKEGRDWLTSKEAVERYLKNRTRQRKT